MSVSLDAIEPESRNPGARVGPADVLATVGSPETLVYGLYGGVLKRQKYVDGTIYEVQVPVGSRFNPDDPLVKSVPQGYWLGTFETDDGRMLIGIWCPD